MAAFSLVLRTTVAATLLLAMVACRGGHGKMTRSEGTTSNLADLAATAVRDDDLPAFGIARVGPGGAIDVAVAGHRSRRSSVPITRNSAFHLGSDTKAMTAVLLATYVQDGKLDLDSTIASHFPETTMDSAIAAATLRDVLGHRAGLDNSARDQAAMYAATDASRARAEAVALALARAHGAVGTYVYANVNYMLAGVVAEQVGGDTWEHLIATRVFEPLHMQCGFGAPTGPSDPLGHDAEGTPMDGSAGPADNPPALGPAGTVHCPMESWARFVVAMMAGLRGEDTAVLKASTVATLFDDDHDYVAGWTKSRPGGKLMYGHDGSNTLWYARAILIPDDDRALLMATNVGDDSAKHTMDGIMRDFLAGN